MRIVGTAGHVDHGKSSLVISLTGHNPDRWIEERERGMTLDLGFAHLRYPDGIDAGIVDVPGHERFLHNMLAGASGMDLLLLVVDAAEGPRAQTREHLQILNFLNVQRAIVVLTKIDLVDAPRLEAAAELVREVCIGTVAEGARVIGVSNVTGAGIDELKSAIHDAIAELPPHRIDAPAFMPVDRVFALQGHGTIVTGTLMQGTIRAGEALVLQPSGQPVRVRALQTFGRKVDVATAGTRVAVNVPGIDVSSIARGEVLAAVREFTPSTEVAISFTPLAGAISLLKRKTPVRAHIGSAEVTGSLIFEAGPPIRANAVPARLVLSQPAVFYPGSRLIVRRMSPKDLLGGAVALGIGQRERSTGAVDHGAVDLHGRPNIQTVYQVLKSSDLAPLSSQRIAAAANVVESAADSAIDELIEDGLAIAIEKPREYLSRDASENAFSGAAACLRSRHAGAPWRIGCSASEIASALDVSDALVTRLLSAWHADGRVAQRARFWHLPDFTPTLTKEQRAFFDRTLGVDPAARLVPSSYDATVRAADAAKITGLREALDSLVTIGALTRIGDDLYRRSQMEEARRLICRVAKDYPGGATMAQLRDAFGTSRKFALPLMEHFDSVGVTIRDGDLRRLRAPAGKAGD